MKIKLGSFEFEIKDEYVVFVLTVPMVIVWMIVMLLVGK